MQKQIIGFFGTIVLMSSQASAQTSAALTTQDLSGRVNTITTAVPFLMICPDSKQGGMGEVGAATPSDGNSIHWNVAKMSFAEKKGGAAISVTPWLKQLVPDIYLYYVAGYGKISKTYTKLELLNDFAEEMAHNAYDICITYSLNNKEITESVIKCSVRKAMFGI